MPSSVATYRTRSGGNRLRTPRRSARKGFRCPACRPGANTALPTVTPSGSDASPTLGSEIGGGDLGGDVAAGVPTRPSCADVAKYSICSRSRSKAKALHTLAEVTWPRSSRSRARMSAISCVKECSSSGVNKCSGMARSSPSSNRTFQPLVERATITPQNSFSRPFCMNLAETRRPGRMLTGMRKSRRARGPRDGAPLQNECVSSTGRQTVTSDEVT